MRQTGKLNIKTIIWAVGYMGSRRRLFVSCILGFCAVEIAGKILLTAGLRGAVGALTAADAALFLKSVGLILLNFAIWWIYAPFSSYFCSYASKKAVCDMKTTLMERVVRLPMKAHDTGKKGELLSALSNDVPCVQRIYDWYFFQVLRTALGGLSGVILMAAIDWRFAAVVFGLGSVSVLVSARFAKKLGQAGAELQRSLARSSVDIYELLKAAKTIRLLRLESRMRSKAEESTREEACARMAGGRLSARMNAVITGVNALCYAAILSTGAVFVCNGLSDWGTVAALMGLKGVTDMLFVEFGQFVAGMQSGAAGAGRVEELMNEPIEGEAAEGFEVRPSGSPVTLHNVSFAYDGTAVLSGFSLRLAPAGITALVGPSGSGKSTLIKLILGLYAPDSGTVGFDGTEAVTLEAIRRKTAYVPQEPLLFRGSIRDNIAWGNPGATQQEIIAAAIKAGADAFISALPHGYETVLFDDGGNLSGGQRQRIALARALLKNTPVLLLDEITSALDGAAEAHILNTIKALSRTKAILLVTHKRELARLADEVIMM